MERPAKTATRKKTTASAPRSAAPRKKKSTASDARPAAATTSSSTATAVATEPTHDQIAKRAHELYERSGHQHGRHDEFWLEAERQLRDELNP